MPRILVVDDDEMDQEQAQRCLRSLSDLEVAFASNGEEGLQEIAVRRPDLVLTDLRMPIMDGLALVERLQLEHPLIPVILITSQGSERIAVQALKAGAASYVPKSELKQDLLSTVRDVLELAQERSSQAEVLEYLQSNRTQFELTNEPYLIPLVVKYCTDSLIRIGFGDESIRTQIGIALMEALSNALVHGNLELSSAMRREQIDEYERLMQERCQQSPYKERRILLTATESPTRVRYDVKDDGPGFDVSSLPDPTAPENLLEVSGRGVMLIRTFMDSVEFNDNGNQISIVKQVDREGAL